MWSRDPGQRIPCFDRCQLIKTWMSNSKDKCCKLAYWSHWHTWTGGRTYLRTDGRDVMAIKTKISRLDGLPYFLEDGAYYCYCAYVLRISRYSGLLSVMLIDNLIPRSSTVIRKEDLVMFDFQVRSGNVRFPACPKYGLFYHCTCSYSLLWFWVILRNKHGFREYSWRDSFG